MNDNVVKIKKEYTAECGHQLKGHRGKCAQSHGHGYVIEVWLKGQKTNQPGLSYDGMLFDYNDLDDVVKPLIDAMDHHFLAKGDEPDLPTHEESIFWLGVRTTAENLSQYIAQWLVSHLIQYSNISLIGVVVHETKKTSAEFIIDLAGIRNVDDVHNRS